MDISDILEDIDPLLKFDTKDKVDLWSYKSILKQQYILNAKGIESDDHNILVKIDQEVKQIFGNYTSPKIIDEKFYLREVPVFYKQPKFLFSKVSLAFHFVEHQEIMEFPTQYSLEYCPIFSSYERDLLSQRFHMNPPYHSVCYLENIEVEVEFDTEFQFTSEGRKETLFIKNSENNFDNYRKK
ncbi:MAG: hypothetical protein IPQ23_03385 [Cytophagaceae bacterium]|nr:hypothetical protein [Cytophagaceae bacterium]